MARRVQYQSDPAGMRELGRERFIGQVAVEGANAVAAWARGNDPGGEYSVQEVGVNAGRANEMRAGAVVTETVRDRGPFKRTLARAAQQARSGL